MSIQSIPRPILKPVLKLKEARFITVGRRAFVSLHHITGIRQRLMIDGALSQYPRGAVSDFIEFSHNPFRSQKCLSEDEIPLALDQSASGFMATAKRKRYRPAEGGECVSIDVYELAPRLVLIMLVQLGSKRPTGNLRQVLAHIRTDKEPFQPKPSEEPRKAAAKAKITMFRAQEKRETGYARRNDQSNYWRSSYANRTH